ncbi:MAG: transporter substrate-binding domain-containing protein [Rhizobiaceae bacterium]
MIKFSAILRRTVLMTAGAAVAVSFLASAPANADGIREQSMGEGLRVAIYNFKPYAYKDENGDLTGVDIEALRHVLGKMKGKIATAQAVDWGALIPGVRAKRFDVVAAGMFVNPKRCAAVQFSATTFGIAQSLVVKKGNPEGIVDYNTIAEKGLTVATIAGAAQNGFAKVSGVSADKIMEIPDNPTGIAALRANRAQVFALSAPGVRVVVDTVPEKDLEGVPTFTHVAGKLAMPHGAFAFSKDADPEFVKEFNMHLKAFIGTPEHLEMFQKHGMQADELPKQTTEELCAG